MSPRFWQAWVTVRRSAQRKAEAMYEPKSRAFKESAREAIADPRLQEAMGHLKTGFQTKRRLAVEALPEFDALRDAARDIKEHVFSNLDLYLERFESRVLDNGGKVHWCSTPEEARTTILDICRGVEARSATKGKSMIAEEIGLNDFLTEHGIETVETDLGEYIVQLAEEPPSHILAPAVHKTKDEIADLFFDHHRKYGKTTRLTEARAMVDEARQVLRRRFSEADVGITGANFLVAETGSVVLVTNEGNGDLTRTLPRTHIVLATIEKVVPTLEDVSVILRVLARSATGQEMSAYTTLVNGPRGQQDMDGPEQYHVVLLDNGRSALLGSEFREALRCIRCGACMNHCPVYAAVGGHTYGWVYPGPIGAVMTPALIGVEEAGHLPSATPFCGRCEEVCPMRIPLPKLMRFWRKQEFERKLSPPVARYALGFWAWTARRPRLYRLGARIAMGLLGRMGRRRGRFRTLPFAGGWTAGRDFPAPEGTTFLDQWAERQ